MSETMQPNIFKYEPEVLVGEIKAGQHPELVPLVTEGYGTEVLDHEDRLQKTIEEFDYPGRAKVFLYREPEKGVIVGEFTAIIWRNTEEDKRGKLLRLYLSDQGIDITDANLAFDVGGVVVNPEYRGQGIAPKLIRSAVDDINPVMVVGQTKNPSAVAARIKALEEKYVVVYGGKIISPYHSEDNNKIARLATDAYLFSRQISQEDIFDGRLHASKPHLVPLDPVDLTNVPDRLRDIFAEINETQAKLTSQGVNKVVWSPLVAVRKDLAELSVKAK